MLSAFFVRNQTIFFSIFPITSKIRTHREEITFYGNYFRVVKQNPKQNGRFCYCSFHVVNFSRLSWSNSGLLGKTSANLKTAFVLRDQLLNGYIFKSGTVPLSVKCTQRLVGALPLAVYQPFGNQWHAQMPFWVLRLFFLDRSTDVLFFQDILEKFTTCGLDICQGS